MAVAWPVSLQQLVNTDSFSLKVGETALRSDMDTGPQKIRRRFTKSVDIYSVSINVTSDEWETLYEFFDVDLNGGVNAFEFNDPITQEPREFRFLAAPEIRPLGGVVFQVSMQWERLP